MSNPILADKPSPEKISFSADCFEVVGERTYYTAVTSLRDQGCVRYESLEAAKKAAKVANGAVTEHKTLVYRRIKWF
jgi:hypothetical protein